MRRPLTRTLRGTTHRCPPRPFPAPFDRSGERFLLERGDAWFEAPDELTLPAGQTLRLRFELPREHDVRWYGAEEVETTRHGSVARVPLRDAGPLVVELEVFDIGGRLVAQRTLRVHVEPPTARAA